MENEKKKRIKWNLESYVEVAKNLHTGKHFAYSEIGFINVNQRITVICLDHDEPFKFTPKAIDHIRPSRPSGCPACFERNRAGVTNRALSQEGFISRCVAKHRDTYGYAKTIYRGWMEKCVVTCKIHGDFEITPNSHLHSTAKGGCQKCGRETARLNMKKDRQVFLDEAFEAHGEKYPLSELVYIGSQTYMAVNCPRHGDFFVKPCVFVKGQGCAACALEDGKRGFPMTTERFITQSTIVHDNKFGYGKTKIVSSLSDIVTILCPVHGEFNQRASNHINGGGCRLCSKTMSGAEYEIGEFLQQSGFEIIRSYKVKGALEIDIFIPALGIGIEYNGLIWHSERYKKNANTYHLEKTKVCEEAGIRLIHIFEDTWLQNQNVCKDWIKSQLGVNKEILNGRQCQVRSITAATANEFIAGHHIQGVSAPGQYCYGLYHGEDRLVGAMIFGTKNASRDGEVLLERFCTKGRIRGGFSKMLHEFIKKHGKDYDVISSFSDKSWSEGKVYSSNDFLKIATNPPRYFWAKRGVRYNRRGFQKQYLAEKFTNFDKDLTEVENCHRNGYYRIWDCGTDKWSLTLPK